MLIDELNFNNEGLIPVIAQCKKSNEILMFAWMNKEAFIKTITSNKVHYYSRSRSKIWLKGEQSGFEQRLCDIFTDCDKDVLLIKIKQTGGISCHTGRKSCFFNKMENNKWLSILSVIKQPNIIYGKK